MIIHKSLIKRHKFNINGCYERIIKTVEEKLSCSLTKKEIENVWKEYLGILKDDLIEKGEVNFMAKIGSLNIFKINISDVKGDKTHIINKEVLNIKRIGYHYFIAFEKGNGVIDAIKFKPNKEIKKRLNEQLKTEKDYKPAPLKYLN